MVGRDELVRQNCWPRKDWPGAAAAAAEPRTGARKDWPPSRKDWLESRKEELLADREPVLFS